jgi:hypothetical protein
MLFNHHRAVRGKEDDILPIGTWKGLRIDGVDIYLTPVFDDVDDFAKRIAGKFERKVIRSASIGIRVLAMEKEGVDEHGNAIYVITKWQLLEVSIVDIPSNENAIAFYDEDDEPIELSAVITKFGLGAGKPPLPSTTQTISDPMIQIDPSTLGLSATATAADITAKFVKLEAENTNLKGQVKDYKDQEITRLKASDEVVVDQAIKDRKIHKAARAKYLTLMTLDRKVTTELLDEMQPMVKLSDIPKDEDKSKVGLVDGKFNGKTYLELAAEEPAELARLEKEEPDVYQALRTAEFGSEA